MGNKQLDLSGQGVVVTGAATSVGREMAEQFLAAGAKVHICDVNADALTTTLEEVPRLTGSVTNVGDPEAVAEMANEAIAALGHVDVLVNNVGVAGPIGPIEDLDVAEWRDAVDINFNGMFFTAKQFVPGMKERKHGVIVNFSTAGTQTTPPFRTNYNAAKAAVEGFTSTLARELGEFGIRCNSIRPGAINNARILQFFDAIAEREGRSRDEIRDELLQFISMRTLIEPADIAATVVFLASPPARHITGQMLAVDGGVEWDK